jgi:hypothetical protein
MDTRFGKCNVESPYRTGSLKIVASELATYILNLVTMQEVGWDSGGSEAAEDYAFLMEM